LPRAARLARLAIVATIAAEESPGGGKPAVLAYKVREALTVDGKPVTFEAADASTWVRRDGQWVCALHTESLAGDPFGRDRRIDA
jgi:hypothetical protein